MNKLDDKVIVDRKTLVELDKFARRLGFDSNKMFIKLNKALAADLTGWVAASLCIPCETLAEVALEYDEFNIDPDSEKSVRDQRIEATFDVFFALLKASPPLPGGGE